MHKINCIVALTLTLIIGACKEKKENIINPSQTIKKPNIIYILADDLGYGDLSSLNPLSKIRTPNMDEVVEDGVHFTDAHSNSSVCTPTRYGILTGRYAFRTRLKEGVLWGYSPSLIEHDRPTIATYLKENGYVTACIGKWHLGLDWQKKNPNKEIKDIAWSQIVEEGYDDNVDYSEKVKGGPDEHGFDYSFIIPASLDMSPYCYLKNGLVTAPMSEYTKGKQPDEAGRGVFWRPGKKSKGFEFEEVLPTFIEAATQYIDENSNGKNPFFMYLPLPAPHTPWLPTEEYHMASNASKYGDYVSMVDDMIGKILHKVSESGIEDDTLIIITSDNGADWRPSDISETNHKANYTFKGRKADIYEAGHRVPFIAKWQGLIPAGIISNQVMCTTDLLATIAGILGKPLPKNFVGDSYNLWPAFIGQESQNPIRNVTIHHSLQGIFSIRKDNWKYTPHLGSGGFTNPKTITPRSGEPPGTLYDMEKDPSESLNLYTEHPRIVKQLDSLLKIYQKTESNLIKEHERL
tara:strand:+ start:17514 stop:19073 length:1560 start_codon:yes stop_codon:yes gene_type:complete